MDTDEIIQLGDLNYVEAMREQTRACGGTIVEEDGVVLMLGSHPHPLLNNAVRLDPALDAGECVEIVGDFYDAHKHGYTLALLSGNDESDLAAAAESAGMVSLLSPPAMVCHSRIDEQALPDGCELRPVTDADGLVDFREVSKEAWATYGVPAEVLDELFSDEDLVAAPHISAVVGYADGAPASAALVLLSHGIGGVFWVGTTPASRSRGLGEACTRAVTNVGFDMGCRVVTLQASPMGHPIYARMGYEEIGTYHLLASGFAAS